MTRFLFPVVDSAPDAFLSPFFTKAKSFMVLDRKEGRHWFLPNNDSRWEVICVQISLAKPAYVICGFIGRDALRHLREAGIDVRLGPCNVPAASLVERVHLLPEAEIHLS